MGPTWSCHRWATHSQPNVSLKHPSWGGGYLADPWLKGCTLIDSKPSNTKPNLTLTAQNGVLNKDWVCFSGNFSRFFFLTCYKLKQAEVLLWSIGWSWTNASCDCSKVAPIVKELLILGKEKVWPGGHKRMRRSKRSPLGKVVDGRMDAETTCK